MRHKVFTITAVSNTDKVVGGWLSSGDSMGMFHSEMDTFLSEMGITL